MAPRGYTGTCGAYGSARAELPLEIDVGKAGKGLWPRSAEAGAGQAEGEGRPPDVCGQLNRQTSISNTKWALRGTAQDRVSTAFKHRSGAYTCSHPERRRQFLFSHLRRPRRMVPPGLVVEAGRGAEVASAGYDIAHVPDQLQCLPDVAAALCQKCAIRPSGSQRARDTTNAPPGALLNSAVVRRIQALLSVAGRARRA